MPTRDEYLPHWISGKPIHEPPQIVETIWNSISGRLRKTMNNHYYTTKKNHGCCGIYHKKYKQNCPDSESTSRAWSPSRMLPTVCQRHRFAASDSRRVHFDRATPGGAAPKMRNGKMMGYVLWIIMVHRCMFVNCSRWLVFLHTLWCLLCFWRRAW